MFTDGPAWQDVARRYRHLVMVPAWQCSFAETPGGEFGYWTFGKLAGAHKMTVNSFYPGRVSPMQYDYFCNKMPRDLQESGLLDDTAYVFRSAAKAYSIPLNGHACRSLDGVILCVKASDAPTFGHDMSGDLAELPLDASVSMVPSNGLSNLLLGSGWSAGEPWGHWTIAHEAGLAFRAQGHGGLRVNLVATAFASATHRQNVEIFANGRHVQDWHFVDGSDNNIGFDLPFDLMGPERVVSLKFVLPDAISPAELGMNDDQRQMGIGLKSILLSSE